ncbi:MAG: phosphoribosylformylglycinamidine synthase I [Anaerolineae bacterium]|nr:phosphoribosylformylglycinamidine synthase I [Anaerolineae bacterium]
MTRALILHAPGTNRDREAALACALAGGAPEIVHLNQLLTGERRLLDYGFLVLPGGFSYGDDLGAGTLWALALRERLGEPLRRFVEEGRPVLGICNGFQALVKAGILPSLDGGPAGGEPSALAPAQGAERPATLARNRSARFECRWVYLRPEAGSVCLFTRGLQEPLYVPVAHGEGNFVPRELPLLDELRARGQVALTYVDAEGRPAGYPDNPNGSAGNVAGICNPQGNVLGLMPHPEDHVFPHQHPRWTRGEAGGMGLAIFVNGVRAGR